MAKIKLSEWALFFFFRLSNTTNITWYKSKLEQQPKKKKNPQQKEITEKTGIIYEIFNYIPGTVLAAWHAWTHLFLTKLPEIDILSLAHITDEETGTKIEQLAQGYTNSKWGNGVWILTHHTLDQHCPIELPTLTTSSILNCLIQWLLAACSCLKCSYCHVYQSFNFT